MHCVGYNECKHENLQKEDTGEKEELRGGDRDRDGEDGGGAGRGERKDSWDKGGGRREKKRERGSSSILYMNGRAQGKQGISQKMHSHRGRRGEGEKSELMEKDEKGRD